MNSQRTSKPKCFFVYDNATKDFTRVYFKDTGASAAGPASEQSPSLSASSSAVDCSRGLSTRSDTIDLEFIPF